MNYRTIVHQSALLGLLVSGIMLVMALLFWAASALAGQTVDLAALSALLATGGVGLAVGAAAWRLSRGPMYHGRKEALLLVALSWIGGAFIGALPFWFWARFHVFADGGHPFQSLINCYFESMSGLTTTGATVLSDIESLPRSLLLWRALTHWLGGLGIVVLFVAVLPGLGVGGKRLFQIEAPGPAPEGLQPHIRETARWLWYIYVGLTVAEIAALWALTPMGAFDAICHTFATLATGGFSTKNAGIGAYDATPAVGVIIVVFMVLAGANFGLYYRMCRGRFEPVLKDVELRVYLLTLVSCVLLCTIVVFAVDRPVVMTDGQVHDSTLGRAFRESLFTAVSIQTTTGFCTADSNRWPFLAKAVLLGVMFIGSSSGSTAGGIKVIRIWIAVKVLLAEIEHAFRPHVVRPVRVGRAAVDPEMRLGATVYVLGILVLFAAGAVTIMLIEQVNPAGRCDFLTAATGCAATLFNVGPGFGAVGAVENYGWLLGGTKLVMCLLMALGRLEVFAIIVLFSPGFWRRE